MNLYCTVLYICTSNTHTLKYVISVVVAEVTGGPSLSPLTKAQYFKKLISDSIAVYV